MALTKKHFEGIAADLANELKSKGHRATVYNIATALSYRFSRENSNFDRSRFLKACGFPDPADWRVHE
jgi:hypothetical protein